MANMSFSLGDFDTYEESSENNLTSNNELVVTEAALQESTNSQLATPDAEIQETEEKTNNGNSSNGKSKK